MRVERNQVDVMRKRHAKIGEASRVVFAVVFASEQHVFDRGVLARAPWISLEGGAQQRERIAPIDRHEQRAGRVSRRVEANREERAHG